ncbi:MAG: sodium-dependent transporter [Nitrospinaceae bacterium]|nr:sodium-dependent transporter [Nitrospinaceae bacterium]NIR56051.1 sodium-dependent transporter [Nitrospinaceae bacterium]NIS86496.1 sodium-dependent transporter [Nitrospinaceae bacterium]NIT83331.1 sodium-dependent transporter [Nitrospinaceae bacterium]NIU45540.1 sodium-dependent transporter [Nitrospinaceae bacterium]
MPNPKKRTQWSSRLAFILAATGSAVGLGNIWKFPYMTGQNGGSAFVLVYLVCIALIGVPIMMAEVFLGRHARQNPIQAMIALAERENRSSCWQLVGWSGTLSGFIIFSFYSVISGWVIHYVYLAVNNYFSGLTPENAQSLFTEMISNPAEMILTHSLFIFITMVVVARGVQKGLEKAVSILMPGLIILLLILLGYSLNSGSFLEAFRFLFYPDFTKLTEQSVLSAMGQAFFTLSLASGAIMVYGSYLPSDASIPRTCMVVAIADTAIALLSGLVVFPIVFAQGLTPASGPGLVFQTLPVAFGAMPGGTLFASLFFILFIFAALTSSISMVEACVAWLEERWRMSRLKASLWVGLAGWTLGLGTVFSFNLGKTVTFYGKTFFESLDFLTANLLLPLGGMALAIFACWLMAPHPVRNELGMEHRVHFDLWRWVAGVIAPAAILMVFLNSIGIF